jgi:hypothetical protein
MPVVCDAGEALDYDLESDLPSLASQAAIELDNYILHHETNLRAAKRLAAKLANSVTSVYEPASSSSLLDPATTVALSRAFRELGGPTQPTHLTDLLAKASELTESLQKPEGRPDEELRVLRSFCIALSRQASTLERSPHDRYDHPFRRSF